MRSLIGPGDHPPTVNCYVLDDVQTTFELSLIQNKSEATPTVNNFVEILLESVRRLKVSGQTLALGVTVIRTVRGILLSRNGRAVFADPIRGGRRNLPILSYAEQRGKEVAK